MKCRDGYHPARDPTYDRCSIDYPYDKSSNTCLDFQDRFRNPAVDGTTYLELQVTS